MTVALSHPRRVPVIDSPAAGEPARMRLSGGLELGTGDIASRLQPGQVWRQEGIPGTVFPGPVAAIPDSADPFREGTAF